jgi:fumarate reductase subunit D
MTSESPTDVAAAVAEIEEQRANRTVVWLLIVLGTVVMVLSTLNTWVERQLLDTDAWVDASTALLEDDAVREELSLRLVNALYENVEVGEAIDERLPEQLVGLGGPLAGVLRDPLTNTADRLLQTEPVQAVWQEANRNAHGIVVAILEDDAGANLSTTDGKVVIDLGGVVRQVGEQIGLPEGVLDAIPDDAGVFEVVDSDRLESAQSSVRIIKILSIVFFLLVIALYCGAIYLAHNWRRATVRNVGAATALGGFIVLVALRFGIGFVAGKPDTEGSRAAANSILEIGTELLRRSAWSEILIGLLIVLGASLIGPARYAKRARHYTAQGFRRSAVATWIGFAVLVLVVLTWSPFSAGGNWVTVLIVLVLTVVGIEAIRRTSLAEEATRIEYEAKTSQADTEMVAAGEQH